MYRGLSLFPVVVALTLLLAIVMQPVFAELPERPKDQVIIKKAKNAKLGQESFMDEKDGKTWTFTFSDSGHIKAVKDLEDGFVFGQLVIETKGEKSKLPAGKYHLFLAKVKGQWHVYAVSGGKVVAETKEVKLEKKRMESPTVRLDRNRDNLFVCYKWTYDWPGCMWIHFREFREIRE
jgi:hypothetical protein